MLCALALLARQSLLRSGASFRIGVWPGLTPAGAKLVLSHAVLLAGTQLALGPLDVSLQDRTPLPYLPLVALGALAALLLAVRVLPMPGLATGVAGAYLLPRSVVALLFPAIAPPAQLLLPALALDLVLWLRRRHSSSPEPGTESDARTQGVGRGLVPRRSARAEPVEARTGAHASVSPSPPAVWPLSRPAAGDEPPPYDPLEPASKGTRTSQPENPQSPVRSTPRFIFGGALFGLVVSVAEPLQALALGAPTANWQLAAIAIGGALAVASGAGLGWVLSRAWLAQAGSVHAP